MSNETTLDDVLALVAKATPGTFAGNMRRDESIYVSVGDPLKGPHAQGDVCLPCPDVDAMVSALNYLRAHGPAIKAALEDARRYNKLKPMMTAANFYPEDPNGLDLGEGVALIFMLPVGTPVCSKLDSIIDGIDAAQELGK